MLTEEVRVRLSKLVGAAPSPPLGFRAPRIRRVDTSLSALVPGAVEENEQGSYYVIRRRIRNAQLDGFTETLRQSPPTETGDLASLASTYSRQAAFLDLETCGFAGSAIFLIGVIHDSGDGLELEQLLARDYREEAAILRRLAELLQGRETLVTFNGKSFDWPMVRDRAAYHRLKILLRRGDGAFAGTHCDLLHLARRQWKDRLPNCRLTTLERHICGRLRRGDIPGAEIPPAYHQFVRDGDARAVRSILSHNALDLLTCVELALRLMVARDTLRCPGR